MTSTTKNNIDSLFGYVPEAYSAWYKTPTSSGSDLGINPELPFDLTDIDEFTISEDGNRVEFQLGSKYWVLEVDELPADRWGNTATYSTGLDLKDGYYQLGYNDDTLVEFASIAAAGYYDPEFEIDDDFIGWFAETYPDNYSTLGESLTCNGTASTWEYQTTDIPLDSDRWEDIIDRYLVEAND